MLLPIDWRHGNYLAGCPITQLADISDLHHLTENRDQRRRLGKHGLQANVEIQMVELTNEMP